MVAETTHEVSVATIVECDPNLCWANRRYPCFTVDAGGGGELNKDARGDPSGKSARVRLSS
jgi:hypothetical protein